MPRVALSFGHKDFFQKQHWPTGSTIQFPLVAPLWCVQGELELLFTYREHGRTAHHQGKASLEKKKINLQNIYCVGMLHCFCLCMPRCSIDIAHLLMYISGSPTF